MIEHPTTQPLTLANEIMAWGLTPADMIRTFGAVLDAPVDAAGLTAFRQGLIEAGGGHRNSNFPLRERREYAVGEWVIRNVEGFGRRKAS